jgi:hypothetical protein
VALVYSGHLLPCMRLIILSSASFRLSTITLKLSVCVYNYSICVVTLGTNEYEKTCLFGLKPLYSYFVYKP